MQANKTSEDLFYFESSDWPTIYVITGATNLNRERDDPGFREWRGLRRRDGKIFIESYDAACNRLFRDVAYVDFLAKAGETICVGNWTFRPKTFRLLDAFYVSCLFS